MTETCGRCNKIAVRSEFDLRLVCSGCNYYEEYCKCERDLKPKIVAPLPDKPDSPIEDTESLDTMRAIVFKILEQDERARNDDTWLQYRICRDVLKLPIFQKMTFEEMSLIPKFETMRRVRQFIQNTEGKFPPTDPTIDEKRARHTKRIREWVRQAKATYVEPPESV